jgi:hypothetical protein
MNKPPPSKRLYGFSLGLDFDTFVSVKGTTILGIEALLMFVGVSYSKISAVGVTLGDFYT